MQEIFNLDREFSPSPGDPVIVIGGAGVDLIGRLEGGKHNWKQRHWVNAGNTGKSYLN